MRCKQAGRPVLGYDNCWRGGGGNRVLLEHLPPTSGLWSNKLKTDGSFVEKAARPARSVTSSPRSAPCPASYCYDVTSSVAVIVAWTLLATSSIEAAQRPSIFPSST